MKTDDLIAILSTHVEPVKPRRAARTIRAALAVGAVLVPLLVFAALGFRSDAIEAGTRLALLSKVAFTLLVFLVASHYLVKLARPGGERQAPLAWVVLPFLAITALAVISLGLAPHSHMHGLLFGDEWLECIISIPVIAVVPFALIVWAVRQIAPTDLPRAGAVAGLVAGCLSAIGYALHCTADSVPFVIVWYGGTIALCTLVGWKLGPRLLRW